MALTSEAEPFVPRSPDSDAMTARRSEEELEDSEEDVGAPARAPRDVIEEEVIVEDMSDETDDLAPAPAPQDVIEEEVIEEDTSDESDETDRQRDPALAHRHATLKIALAQPRQRRPFKIGRKTTELLAT